ncbi:MAG: ankyrin repeat protein [Paraglaciecola sp.]
MAIKYGANPNGFNPYKDETPIFKSLSADDAKKLELIIEAKADVNFQNLDKDTPLMWAASLLRYKFVDMLLKNSADHCIKIVQKIIYFIT